MPKRRQIDDVIGLSGATAHNVTQEDELDGRGTGRHGRQQGRQRRRQALRPPRRQEDEGDKEDRSIFTRWWSSREASPARMGSGWLAVGQAIAGRTTEEIKDTEHGGGNDGAAKGAGNGGGPTPQCSGAEGTTA